jgi:cytochrome c oxidase subunit 2
MLSALMTASVFAETKDNIEQYQLNMTKGVTDISAGVYDMHMLMFLICVVIDRKSVV